jgi:hypothetical protein
MVQKSGVNVHIGSEFDAKGFKQAQSALSKLGGSAKKLAGAVGLAYGAKALVAYGKASMKAAADDQKAQKILAQNLKNVGLAYASVDAESFIKSMETQTAVLDDQLRPAYSQLAQVTGSATKTQELMQLAFDVSSGSGLDYASTVDILSQAYVGNTKGLKQLNLGLTQAELKTMDFAQIQTKLRQNFAGAGGVALDSYAGSMARLGVATSNASETIGTALLDAIIKISGSNGVDGLISKIDTLASAFASVVTQVGNAVAALTGTAAQKAFSPGYYVSGGKAGGRTVAPTGAGNMTLSVLSQDTQKSDLAAKKKAENDAIKRNKELAALAKSQAKSAAATLKSKQDQAKLDKATAAAQLALGKGTDVFDMDKIQINAALINQAEALGKATTTSQVLAIANDVARLKVKQDMLILEDAIASKDVARIDAATKQLNADLKILSTLQSQNIQLLSTKVILDALKPVDLINQSNLDEALKKIYEMMLLLSQLNQGSGSTTTTTKKPAKSILSTVPKLPLLTGKESIGAILEVTDSIAVLADVMAQIQEQENYAQFLSLVEFQKKLGDFGGYSTSMSGGAGSSMYGYSPVVTVEVIDKTSGLIEVVQNAVQENNRYGNNLTYAGAIS